MREYPNKALIRFFQILIICGIGMKFYGLTDPWKRHDHYNFGGVFTTAYAECLKSTPLEVSKGIPHICHRGTDDTITYYRAHPPTILFAFWGWTSLFGAAEWSYRLFVLLFSVLNIGLVYFIARRARPESPIFPWAAAGFQSVFLGNMYFGTHLDFIGEFTVFFVLATALSALHQRLTLASILGLGAGLSAWPGYIVFGPLWLYTLLIKKGRKRVFLTAIAGLGFALASMMWLHQTTDIVDFLRLKLLRPGYIRMNEKGWSEPVRFVLNFFGSMARLLSPLFAALALFELARGEGRAFFQRRRWPSLSPFHHAILLSGGTGFIYALVGHEYFMVHVYLYLLLTPAMALLCASFCERVLESGGLAAAVADDRKVLTVLALFLAAVYPYGIFKTNSIHDALTSSALILASLGAIYGVWRRVQGAQLLLALVALSSLGNASQVVNYRNEPDTERSFCDKARAEYARTGKPVETTEEESDAKSLIYCVGIPIKYSVKAGDR